MDAPNSNSTRVLLEESAWLRRLALSLVSDSSAADDAVQGTLTVALERPPGAGVPRRPWLARVLRNLVRQSHRAVVRRQDRESAVARSEVEDSTIEVVERLTIQRRVVEAVETLDEPYRTAIVLRFLDGHPPREVARRTQAPVKTVHTRIDRGLARLRARLDGEYGDRTTWSAMLMPFLPPAMPAVIASKAIGLSLMSTKTALGVTALAACAIGIVVYRSTQTDLLDVSLTDTAVSTGARAGSGALNGAPQESDEWDRRVALTSLAHSAERETHHTETGSTGVQQLEGRVIDTEGHGLAGLLVQFQPTAQQNAPLQVDEEPTVSGPQGQFSMDVPGQRGRLLATGEGYASIVRPLIHGQIPERTPEIVVAPRESYAGVVVDEQRLPVAGAAVVVSMDQTLLERLSDRLVHAPIARMFTDDRGAFQFEGIGVAPGTTLRASRDGVGEVEMLLREDSDMFLRLVLNPDTHAKWLRGTVVDRMNEPVAGAYVGIAAMATRSDDSGSFSLDLSTLGEGSEALVLTAVDEGSLPSSIELPRDRTGLPAEMEGHLLVLGGDPLTISGRVLDTQGEPLAGTKVWTFDGHDLGRMASLHGGVEVAQDYEIEEILVRSVRGEGSREDDSGADGEFLLRGLVDAKYTILAMHPVTQAIVRVPGVRAGREGVVLSFEGQECAVPVGGRVVNAAGAPIPNARVTVRRWVDVKGGERRLQQASMGHGALTNSEGYFLFEGLCPEQTTLQVNGKGIASGALLELEPHMDLEALEIQASARCLLQVHLDELSDAGYSFALRTVEGESLALGWDLEGTPVSSGTVLLQGGRSQVVRTNDSARVLILFQGESEIQRVPIRLKPGQLNVIHI